MNSGYTKLFGSIVGSTIWREPDHVRIVWITMLALKDRDHVVTASLPGLADYARISLVKCKEALEVLKAPDEFSTSKEFEGRRIREVDGGWEILNGEKYHEKLSAVDKAEKNAARQARWRERQAKLKALKEKEDAEWAAKNEPSEGNGELMDGSPAAVEAGRKKIADRKTRAEAREDAAIAQWNAEHPGRAEREAARDKELAEIEARMTNGEPPPDFPAPEMTEVDRLDQGGVL